MLQTLKTCLFLVLFCSKKSVNETEYKMSGNGSDACRSLSLMWYAVREVILAEKSYNLENEICVKLRLL